MRRLLPTYAAGVDPFESYQDVPARWLRVGMVTSADGSATDEQGWTAGLGGEADFRVFRTLRALADGILVGAATIRTGHVGPHRLRADLRARRDGIGKPGPAPIIVVTGSLDLDWRLPLFTSAESPTLIATCAAALDGAVVPDALRPYVFVAGSGSVDLDLAVRELRDRFGLRHLLCEGGPELATRLIRAGLVDELCLNVAPTLIGARNRTPLLAALPKRVELQLSAAYEDEHVIFLRYRLRNHSPQDPPGT